MNPPRNTPSRPELLAPAGEREAAYAAFAYGADAVYLGLQRFSARAEATNFTLEELADLVGFAHSQASPLRVYVTLNTLVRGDELPELIETILALAELGIDALIVQDLGLIRLVREYAPGLRLHASTQMAIHSKDGLAAAGLLGIRRAVLAREMTLDEIRELTVDTSVEVEVFTHGALCYSYSGLCLLSSHACGRSGNRGKCAYLCRNHFTDSQSSVGRSPGSNENGLLLSMNDLALGSTVKELVAARVSALKIEGRMKTPRYVAAATHLYRRLLDGDLGNDEKRQIEDDVKTIFSRPWTQFHVHERTAGDVVNPAQLGHLGVPIGRVKDVVRSSDRGDALRFRVSGRELERHDGLNVAIPGRARPYGFAAEQLWRVAPSSTWTREFSAPPGTMVAVELPDRHPPINPGETIYCASSLAVRRRYTWSSPKVGITRSRLPLQVTVCAQPDSLECRASTQRPNASSVTETTLMIKGDFPPARTPGQLETALSKSFSRLGDTPFELKALTVTGDTQRFVPISQLNEIRREITCSLAQILG
ncbi:MAG: U32 family peptidase, partial [Lentisphaerae bacterium]|nr:U32 family peptidase [Lentisphaerota bacterium]